MKREQQIEILAKYAHKSWSGWTKYMLGKCLKRWPGDAHMPREFVDRWTRQMNTPYEDLPESEKEPDRVEARKMLELLGL